MINLIAAIDIRRGIANDEGIPWKLPMDSHYFRAQIKGSIVIMGKRVYDELVHPFEGCNNFVLTHQVDNLREGFSLANNLNSFIQEHSNETIWVVGGALLYEQTLPLADQLYLTQLDTDFSCTKFFPIFSNNFILLSETPKQKENNISFSFQIWRKK
jgi:dihydrofolate reductase